MQGGGGGVAGSQPMSTAVHRSPNKLGDLTPYLSFGFYFSFNGGYSSQLAFGWKTLMFRT